MTGVTLEEREAIINQGRHAKYLLDSEAFQAVCSQLLDQYFADFLQTDTTEGAVRDMLWAKSQSIMDVNRYLEAQKSSGEVEQRNKEFDDGK